MVIRKLSFLLFACILAVFSANSIQAQAKAPQWLSQASAQQTPRYEIKNVPVAVLYKEENLNVKQDGTITRTVRQAIRILEREGREEAYGGAVYQTDSDRLRSVDGWLIKKNGTVKTYGKKETVDVSLVSNDFYNEARRSYVSAEDSAEVGDVFGYEAVVEERSIFSQFHFSFQYNLPVLYSRFVLQLPPGWKAQGVIFNAPKFEPSVFGSTYTWEMRDLKPIRPEPSSPRPSSIAPRLAVSMFPDGPGATHIKTFSTWNDVAKWMAEIEDPQMTTSPALIAKAKELTANASTELDKIRAISKYVQQIQYISIQIGAGRGGGYIPRPSAEVFTRSYGDCKDKANLMRAMLSAVGIESYLVSITADDAYYVRAEWASPHQFNHCIIAIKIGDKTQAESVVTHEELGRLLIFDPTDAYTPIGDIPEDQQGSLALIDHKTTTELIRMPVMSSDLNRLDREVEITLTADGAITGNVVERTVGQTARYERARFKGLSLSDYNRVIDRWVSRGATGAKTTSIVPTDRLDEGRFDLKVEFNARSYGQLMQRQLLIFKPAVLGRLDRLSFGDGKRLNPYLIDASAFSETARIQLPEDFEIDEMPESAKIETEFGKYVANFKVEDGKLIFTRSLELVRTSVPPEKYDSIKNFFGKMHSTEQSPVVLVRK